MNSPNDITHFQNQLTHALEQSDVASDSFVVVKLDEDAWLLDLAYLKEASVPSRIAKNVGGPAWALGVANFKSEVWTLVDMRMVLKNTSNVNPSWGWVTLLRAQQGQEDVMIGLLWSEIVEIASKQEYDPLSTEFSAVDPWCRMRYRDKNGKIWKELDVDQIVGVGGLIAQWRGLSLLPTSS